MLYYFICICYSDFLFNYKYLVFIFDGFAVEGRTTNILYPPIMLASSVKNKCDVTSPHSPRAETLNLQVPCICIYHYIQMLVISAYLLKSVFKYNNSVPVVP